MIRVSTSTVSRIGTLVMLAMVGIVLLLASTTKAQNSISNPSFEEEHDGTTPNGESTSGNPDWGMPDDWSWTKQGNMNGHGVKGAQAHATDGEWCLYLFALYGESHYADDYLEFRQIINLSTIKRISFDYYLGSTFEHCRAYFRVGAQILWTNNVGGSSGTADVDVGNIYGTTNVSLGVQVVEDYEDVGPAADGRTWFDNVRVSESRNIPTLTQYGLIILVILVAGSGIWLMIRKRRVIRA